VRHAREQSLHQVGEKPINRIGCGFFYQQKNEHFKDDRFHRKTINLVQQIEMANMYGIPDGSFPFFVLDPSLSR